MNRTVDQVVKIKHYCLEAWGFEYKTSIVLDKIRHNWGHYISVRHEFLLFCGRGQYIPDTAVLEDSSVTIERKGHSEKPEYFRALIDRLYPHGPRIEIFVRKTALGWDVWGNEVAMEEGE
jgi:N6-adenosine-specific RNA methylase IME4